MCETFPWTFLIYNIIPFPARFLRKQLPEVVQAVLQIAHAEQLESDTRIIAAEFLVTAALAGFS